MELKDISLSQRIDLIARMAVEMHLAMDAASDDTTFARRTMAGGTGLQVVTEDQPPMQLDPARGEIPAPAMRLAAV